MNKGQAVRCFRAMWRWCSKHPEKEKRDYPKWERNGGPYTFMDGAGVHCFLCGLEGCGKTCAVVWPGGNCMNIDSLYHAWQMAKGKKRTALALQISKLPLYRGEA